MASIYVDESGDLGQKGSRYFVIAAISPSNKKRLDNIVKRHCAANGIVEIKAYNLTFPTKEALLKKISSVHDYSVSYVVADKNHIDPLLFSDKNVLYNYIYQWVVEPIAKASTESINIITDNHSTRVGSRNSLGDYVKAKAYFDWKVSNPISLQYLDSKSCRAIQVADLIANTVFSKYMQNKNHLYSILKIKDSIKFPSGKFGT